MCGVTPTASAPLQYSREITASQWSAVSTAAADCTVSAASTVATVCTVSAASTVAADTPSDHCGVYRSRGRLWSGLLGLFSRSNMRCLSRLSARSSQPHLERQQLSIQSFLVGVDNKWAVLVCWGIDYCGVDLPFRITQPTSLLYRWRV